MSPMDSRFADAGLNAASKYDRRFGRFTAISEIIDTLRRQAAFDTPLKFVLDRDPENSWIVRKSPLWDFGNAGVRFEKREVEGSNPALVVTWSDDIEQKTLQEILDEIKAPEFEEDAEVTIELVSPKGKRMLSQYGNGIDVGKDNMVVHFVGAWQK